MDNFHFEICKTTLICLLWFSKLLNLQNVFKQCFCVTYFLDLRLPLGLIKMFLGAWHIYSIKNCYILLKNVALSDTRFIPGTFIICRIIIPLTVDAYAREGQIENLFKSSHLNTCRGLNVLNEYCNIQCATFEAMSNQLIKCGLTNDEIRFFNSFWHHYTARMWSWAVKTVLWSKNRNRPVS